MKPLTKNQTRILKAIAKYTYKFGYQPSYRELAKTFGFQSPGSITAYLKACEGKGACKRIGMRAVSFNWKEYL